MVEITESAVAQPVEGTNGPLTPGSADSSGQGTEAPGGGPKTWALRLLREHSWELLLGVILVGTVVYNATQSDVYLDVDNFVNLFHLSIEKVIVAVIMTFVIINGEIDLSVGSSMAMSAAVLGAVHDGGSVPFAAAIVAALAVATLAGALQGLIIARTELPSLVVTLAGLIGFRGVARVLLEDRSVGDFPDWFTDLGRSDLLGPMPFSLVLFFLLLIGGGVVLHRSAFGRKVFVIGNSAEVARYSGLDVARVKLLLFASSGFMAGLAGVLFAARLGSVRANIAQGFELDIITMVLLGGVSIFGGSGSLPGVALSIFTVLNIRNGLGLANVETTTQTGVIGALLILSVMGRNLFDQVLAHRPARVDPDPADGSDPEEAGEVPPRHQAESLPKPSIPTTRGTK